MLNMSNFAPMLKTLYPNGQPKNLIYKNVPFFASLKTRQDFYGKNKEVPFIYANPQGRSANFVKAQNNKGNTLSDVFVVTRDKDYGLISVDNETIEASKNDAGAFASARKVEIDGIFQSINNTLGVDVHGSGSGSRGQIASDQALSATEVSLEEPTDIVKIEIGMKLVVSGTDGGGTVRSGAGYVISVNRRAGSFKMAATAGGSAVALNTLIGTVAVGDYIFVDGDYDAKVKGIEAWLPYGGPSATPFFGVNRQADETRLAGMWEDYSALSIEEALIEGGSLMEVQGAMVDEAWVHPTKMADLVKSLGTKVQYVDKQTQYGIGVRGVVCNIGNQTINVFADRYVPKNRLRMLQSDTWSFESLGGAPRILNMDQLEALREATADGIEIRIGYYGQLICSAPGWNGNFKI